MTPARIITALGLAASIVAAPTLADAQSRGRTTTGRAVARTGPPPRGNAVRPNGVRVVPYGPYYYYPYRPGLGLGFGYYGYPRYPSYYAPYPYGYGYSSPAYGYGYSYGYGYRGYAARPYGGVRIDVPQRDAEVYADGYFVGNVDAFDGSFQQLNLEAGPHRIEIRAAGFEPISFDVNVEPGRTITYRAGLRPAQP